MLSLDPEIRDQAYQFFTQESLELLQILETGLLNLRHDRSTPQIHELMRAAHSIKGGAASVDLISIKAIAHQLEDVLRVLYRQEVEINPKFEELLLSAYDCLRSPLVQQIQLGTHDEDAAIQQAEPIFAHIKELLGHHLEADIELPTTAELGVDIVQIIFTGDVEQGLTRLEGVLSHPEAEEVAGEIRAQAEVFLGIGQLVNLPGFVALAETTLAALKAQPEKVIEIGELTLANFRTAQAEVLQGDRSQGGILDEALVALAYPASSGTLGGEELAIEGEVEILSSSFPIDSLDGLEDIFGDEEVPINTQQESLSGLQDFFGDTPSLVSKPSTEVKTNLTQISPYLSNTVRVDFNRLERLNNLVSELTIQENSSSLQNQQLQETLALILQRFDRFEQITKDLQDWNDRSHKTKAQISYTTSTPLPPSTPYSLLRTSPQSDFDPLQMDSFNQLQTVVQEAVEEIAQFSEAIRDIALITQQSQQTLRKKQQTLKQVRNDLHWARMLPIGDLLQRFPRMVRDLSAKFHKKVSLKLNGTTTLVDRAALEKLYDPLVHLVRNAFDHGIEALETRQAQGKPTEATIEIRAYHRGNHTYIEVRDDGKGIDLASVRSRITTMQLLSANEVAALADHQVYEYLFHPGFSTASQVSELSGRGMGLDAVRSHIRQLKGSINLTSEHGKGTTFTLCLPLTLTIAKLLIFSINSNWMAIPIDTLLAILTVSPDQFQTVQGKQFYHWQEQLIPVYSQAIFSPGNTLIRDVGESPHTIPLPKNGKIPLLLIAGESQTVALQVDQIIQEQELVIKPFGQVIKPPPYLLGCTILGDGSLVPVLEGHTFVAYQQHHPTVAISSRPMKEEAVQESMIDLQSFPGASQPPTVLIVDDSLTTRQTLTLSLKKAGYQTLQARDGREALDCLNQKFDIQVVFCDVEMPRMNGFEFLTHCRQSFSQTVLPVVMLTSRSGEKHRQIATLLGANAYLTKPYLEHEVLTTLRTLIKH
jgi:two-component system, chemotaxis family, sensor histidine kinase and response regulator PixL